jgi:hypothetical protein
MFLHCMHGRDPPAPLALHQNACLVSGGLSITPEAMPIDKRAETTHTHFIQRPAFHNINLFVCFLIREKATKVPTHE